ncbi:MAG: hypothetical protein RSD27_08095 [Ruthenibacterium sp.]
MTQQDWKIAEGKIKADYDGCKLLVDGYHVTLHMEPMDAYKNIIVVYVDGKCNMKWCLEDCEERRRFCCAHKRSLIKTKKQREALKGLSKKSQEAVRERASYYAYLPWWSSFAPLKRHLIANNASIELAREDKL